MDIPYSKPVLTEHTVTACTQLAAHLGKGRFFPIPLVFETLFRIPCCFINPNSIEVYPLILQL